MGSGAFLPASEPVADVLISLPVMPSISIFVDDPLVSIFAGVEVEQLGDLTFFWTFRLFIPVLEAIIDTGQRGIF